MTKFVTRGQNNWRRPTRTQWQRDNRGMFERSGRRWGRPTAAFVIALVAAAAIYVARAGA